MLKERFAWATSLRLGVIEMKSFRLFRAFAQGFAIIMTIMMVTPAMAQICGLTTISGGTVNAIYDPFSPTSTTIANTTIILQRINGSGADRTNTINFNFYSDTPGLNGLQVNGVSLTPLGGTGTGILGGGAGQNLFFGSNETPPTLVPTGSPSVPSRTGFFNFNGNATNNDSFQLKVNVVLPSSLDTVAGTTIPLNLRYSCIHGQGGNAAVESGTRSNALVINVTILSALQASYVGTPTLDFGEVGSVTSAQVLGLPATYTRKGDIRVASSGPYNISMTSANNYRLSFNGTTGAINPLQSLAYAATFVQNTRTGVSGAPIAPQTAITRTCARAGVSGLLLPLSVTLKEGGLGPAVKTPAPTYSDTLTITVAPKLEADVGIGSACP
jgi:hypothetical protein